MVEDEMKGGREGPQESSYIAEYLERLLVKLNLLLEIIDGVYPTIEWHVGTLAQVAWTVCDRKLRKRDDCVELCSPFRANIPGDLIDAIIII